MSERIVVVGASLSGIDALRRLIGSLPADFPAPILICQHVAPHSPGLLPQILAGAGKLKAVHPRSPQVLEPGTIYVAPPDRHMLVEKGFIRLSHGPHENFARPAVDPLFRSVAIAYGPAAVGVVLTGQLDDGTAGLLAIKDRGGTTIVQEPSEAAAPSMPTSALRHVPVDHRCGLAEMADLLTGLARDDPSGVEAEPSTVALIETENRIAQGVFRVEDWWRFEQMSTPSGYNCPTCRSAVYEVKDKRLLRFRCRSGHAFSALSLLSGQADARECLLSSLFGALVEETSLTKRLLSMPEYAGEPHIGGGLAARATELEVESGQVCGWLHALTGLVEPEPG
jgi:two-component system chemotaxis response regulator CheB